MKTWNFYRNIIYRKKKNIVLLFLLSYRPQASPIEMRNLFDKPYEWARAWWNGELVVVAVVNRQKPVLNHSNTFICLLCYFERERETNKTDLLLFDSHASMSTTTTTMVCILLALPFQYDHKYKAHHVQITFNENSPYKSARICSTQFIDFDFYTILRSIIEMENEKSIMNSLLD